MDKCGLNAWNFCNLSIVLVKMSQKINLLWLQKFRKSGTFETVIHHMGQFFLVIRNCDIGVRNIKLTLNMHNIPYLYKFQISPNNIYNFLLFVEIWTTIAQICINTGHSVPLWFMMSTCICCFLQKKIVSYYVEKTGIVINTVHSACSIWILCF